MTPRGSRPPRDAATTATANASRRTRGAESAVPRPTRKSIGTSRPVEMPRGEAGRSSFTATPVPISAVARYSTYMTTRRPIAGEHSQNLEGVAIDTPEPGRETPKASKEGEGRYLMKESVSPDQIERATFGMTLRGYDRDEVDIFLRRVADELRESQRLRSEKLYENLGDEIGTLLQHAKDNADAMTKQAEEDS